MEIRLNVSNAYINKELKQGFTNGAKSYSFKRSVMTLEQLSKHVASGGAFALSMFNEDRRKGRLWVSSQVVGVDLDNPDGTLPNASEIAQMPFIRDFAWLVYPTPSSTPQKPKTRVIFILSEAVTQGGAWLAMQEAVNRELAHLNPDTTSIDLARMFYGSTQTGHILLGHILPVEMAGGLCEPLAQLDYQKTLIRREKPVKPVALTSTRAQRYAAATLENLLTKLENTPQGQRNKTLYKISYALMCKALGNWPGIDAATVERSITAIISRWDNVAKSEDTMRNGFNDAQAEDLELPEDDQHTPQNTSQSAIKADLVVNTPYVTSIADKLPKTGVIVMISPTATGKTTLNKQVSAGRSTLVVAPLKSLTNNAANTQEIEYYESIPHEYRTRVSRLAICLPSLKRFATENPQQFPRYDVLQLDEFSRNLEMFRSREIFPENDATIVMSVQEKLIKDTPLVMVTDAYITDAEIDYLRTLRDDVFVVRNIYTPDYGKLTVYPEREQLQNAMEKAIKADQGAVVFVSTSKSEVDRQHEYFAGIYGKEHVISIHSGNATNKRQREFLKVIGDSSTDAAKQAAKAKIEQYAVVLASPSLLTGFDVQPTVYRVFANLYSDDIDAAGCMQLIRRYRNAEEVHIWIEPTERNLPTSAETIYNRYRIAADRTKQLVMMNEDDNQPDFDGIIARSLHLQSAIEARRNRSLNNLYESFLTLARPHYQITMVTTDAPASNLERLKEASEAVKARFKELTLTVAPISPEMHQDRSERGIRTDEDNAALNRWHIERLYRQTITEDLYNLYSDGKGATELHAYIDVMHSLESELKRHDKQQIIDGVPIHLRDNRAMKSRTIKRVMLAVFNQRRNMHADYMLPASEIIERFETYAALHPDLMDDLSLYCGLSRNDASRAPLTIVKRICRLMGLALRKEEHPPKGTPKEAHLYGLEPDSLELMNQLAEHRLNVIAEEKADAEQNARTKPNIIIDAPAATVTADNSQALYDAIPSANKNKPSVLERFKPATPFKFKPGVNPNPFASNRIGAGDESAA